MKKVNLMNSMRLALAALVVVGVAAIVVFSSQLQIAKIYPKRELKRDHQPCADLHSNFTWDVSTLDLKPEVGHDPQNGGGNGTRRNTSDDDCELPPGGFTAWRQGVVTVLTPDVQVNCSKAFDGDEQEIERVSELMSSWKNAISDDEMLRRVRTCTWLRRYFSGNLYNSKLEKLFPIAFTFVVYDSPQQILRLLRLMYRPQNSFCIHYDRKSKHKKFFQSIAACFDNVIIPSKLASIVWGHFSVLEAQMNCMTDLLKLRAKQEHKWKYLLNICGKELPLVTNREIVAHLKRFNGSSVIGAYNVSNPDDFEMMSRIQYPITLNKERNGILVHYKGHIRNPPFDPKTQYFKSQSYVAVSHAFASYLDTNSRALKVRDFFKRCRSPEEHYYATLFMMHGVPGGYSKELANFYFPLENVYWSFKPHNCSGKYVHKICVVNLGDLQEVANSSGFLFHNKYFMEYDHTVMKCMEEKIVERNKLEYYQECDASPVASNS